MAWQQRDPIGLWGGLWCLPIIEDKNIIRMAQFDLTSISIKCKSRIVSRISHGC
jgi:adenine-specific DNA glycosylase